MAVAGIEVTRREVVAGGEVFGAAGPYELITGVMRFAVDPDHPRNAAITDLGLAPRDSDGRVQFDADLVVLRPAGGAGGNRRLLFEVVNRGRKQAMARFNRATQGDAGSGIDRGDGFLMRHGYTVAWCGWQHDVPAGPGVLALRAPEALENGNRLRGRLQVEFQPGGTSRTAMLSDRGHRPYPTADLNDPDAVLSVRETDRGVRRVIPRAQWRFGREEDGAPVPDSGHIFLASGFEAGKLYDVAYTAVGAPVVGVGLLSMRDAVSFLRNGTAAAGNPCAGALDRAYVMGGSQSGRFLRHFLYLGLNEDEEERLVFDGAIAHIAAHARGQFNQRFGQPSSVSKWDNTGAFPFASSAQKEALTGGEDGLLERLRIRNKLPKIFFINSAKEYWNGGAALTHADPEGKRDIPLPANVRGYLMAGTQHTSGVLPLVDSNPGDGGRSRYPQNSVDYRPILRAALLNLDAWVSQGVEPPASRLPTFSDGTLVPAQVAAATHAALPGVELPVEWPQVLRLDFGPQATAGILALPPRLAGEPYPSLVSAVDGDGNDLAGIRLPDVSVPLGTFTGWNLRHAEVGAPDLLFGNLGATHPFARTTAERLDRGDPRLSIEERYPSKEAYLARVRQATDQLVAERYLLAEDVEVIVEQAALRWELFTRAAEAAAVA